MKLALQYVGLLALIAFVGAVPSTSPNMNGAYLLTPTPNASDTSKMPTNYKDYPGGVEYFEVYSDEITSLYSQVFWKGLSPVPIPADVVARFDGKVMAVVGFEMDQVRRVNNNSADDVSVPINVACK